MEWINQIANSIQKVFNSLRAPLGFLPPILLMCEIVNRPGLSCIALTSSIIQKLEQYGINTDPNVNGGQNKINLLVKAISCSVVEELQNNCVIEGVIPPGTIVSVGQGGNAGGPVTVVSSNTIPTSFRAIPR